MACTLAMPHQLLVGLPAVVTCHAVVGGLVGLNCVSSAGCVPVAGAVCVAC